MRAPNAMGETPGETVKLINGILFSKGDKVRLKLGQRRSDTSDIFLHGRTATIEVIHTDYEDTIHIAVTIDDDPGQDMLRELGMYLYFSVEEVEHI
jgi:hypothetical protein